MRASFVPLVLVSFSLACPQPGEDEGIGDEASTTESESVGSSDTTTDTDTTTDSDTGEPPTGLAAQGFAWVDPGIAVEWVGFGDFDGDGFDDLFAKVLGGTGRTYLGDGQGGFDSVAELPLAWPSDFMRAGDFDGDGDLDLALFAEYQNGDFQVLLNDGAGTFAPAVIVPIDGFFGFGVVPLRDDGDAIDDLFVPQGHSEGGLLALGSGGGNFSPSHIVMGPACYFSATAVNDVDGDGREDLAGTGSCNSVPDFLPLMIYRHVGVDDALDVAQTIFAELGPVIEGADLLFVDVDGDGERDLVTPTTLGLYLIRAVGDGSFADPPQVLAHDFDGYPRRLVALGPKGDPIFVLGAEPYDMPLEAALLIPNEGLTALTTELLEDPGRIVGSADFDGDGQPDLAVLHGPVPAQLGLWLSGAGG